jgi:hypothetical protein
MLYKFTETKSQSVIAINPRHIVAVFENMEPGDFRGKTILNLVNGAVAIDEDLLTVMGILEAR